MQNRRPVSSPTSPVKSLYWSKLTIATSVQEGNVLGSSRECRLFPRSGDRPGVLQEVDHLHIRHKFLWMRPKDASQLMPSKAEI